MTREEAIAKLNDISTWSDTEAAHYAADDSKELTRLLVLCLDRLYNNDPYFSNFISKNDELLEYLHLIDKDDDLF